MPQIVYSKEEYDQMCIQRDQLAARCDMLAKELWKLQYAALSLAEKQALDRVPMKDLDGMGKLDAIKYVRERCDVSLLLAKTAVDGWIASERLIWANGGRVYLNHTPRIAPRLTDMPEVTFRRS